MPEGRSGAAGARTAARWVPSATRSQVEVPARSCSTGALIAAGSVPASVRRPPRHASTQTHCMSGRTSQLPSCRTPPHGPLRSCLGQFIGHDMPVAESAQPPHIRQSNRNP